MQSVHQALAATARINQDIDDLLKAIRVILSLSEARLSQGLGLPPHGGLRAMNDDVRQLHDICQILADLALGIAGDGQESIEEATSLITATYLDESQSESAARECQLQLSTLSAAAQAIVAVKGGLAASNEMLEEAVLRSDPSPRILEDVGLLLSRLRRSGRT